MQEAEGGGIAVITNLRTHNIGNQALSTELMRLVCDVFPVEPVTFLGRAPAYPGTSPWELTTAGPKAFSLLERWAQAAADRAGAGSAGPTGRWSPGASAEPPLVEITGDRPGSERRRRIGRAVKTLGLRPVADRLEGKKTAAVAAHRCQTLAAARLVIHNPAGEFSPEGTEQPLRQLVELRTAQLLGCRLAVVNLSFESEDPALVDVATRIFATLGAVVVRDPMSRDRLITLGVPGGQVHVVPDLGLLAEPTTGARAEEIGRAESVGPNTVAVAVSYLQAERQAEGWERVIADLQRRGKHVLFVSNAMTQDAPVGRRLRERFGIALMSRQYDYSDYAALLQQVQLVVSSRLHTGVLAVAGGTPVVPVEPTVHKSQAFFRSIDYPIPAVDSSRPGWDDAVLAGISRGLDDNSALRKTIRDRVAAARSVISLRLPPLLRSAYGQRDRP